MIKHLEEIKQLYAREKFLVVSNIAIMTVTLVLMGFFISLAVGLQTSIKNLEQQAQVTLFFENDFPEANILELRDNLMQDDRVLDVTYVSKEDAFKIFTDINKDEPILLEAISKDILPASLEIRTQKLVKLDEIAQQFQDFDGVEEVKFFKDVVDRFQYWVRIVYVVGGVLTFIFLALSVSIIVATLRISIGSKSDEIEILRLVGATDDYIKAPFVSQGVSFGLLSGVVSALISLPIIVGVDYLGFYANGVALIPGIRLATWIYAILITLFIIILGWVLGLIGSSAAVKKYLN